MRRVYVTIVIRGRIYKEIFAAEVYEYSNPLAAHVPLGVSPSRNKKVSKLCCGRSFVEVHLTNFISTEPEYDRHSPLMTSMAQLTSDLLGEPGSC